MLRGLAPSPSLSGGPRPAGMPWCSAREGEDPDGEDGATAAGGSCRFVSRETMPKWDPSPLPVPIFSGDSAKGGVSRVLSSFRGEAEPEDGPCNPLMPSKRGSAGLQEIRYPVDRTGAAPLCATAGYFRLREGARALQGDGNPWPELMGCLEVAPILALSPPVPLPSSPFLRRTVKRSGADAVDVDRIRPKEPSAQGRSRFAVLCNLALASTCDSASAIAL